MPLFIDANGRTRLIEIPRPYPPKWYLKRVKGFVPVNRYLLVPAGAHDDKIEFVRTTPWMESSVIYESKETAFEDPWQKI